MDLNPLMEDSRLLDAYQTLISSPSSVVNLIIDENPEVVNFRTWQGLSVLHQVCMRGTDGAAVSLLIARGAGVDGRSQSGETPLHYACRKGCLPIVSLLLKHGADATAVDNLQHGCMHFAAQGNSVNVMYYLHNTLGLPYFTLNSAKQLPIHIAALHGNWQTTAFLLRQERNPPHHADVMGNVPMHLAAMRGDAAICCQLVSASQGYVSTLKNNRNETALDVVKAGTTTAHRIAEKFLSSPKPRPVPLFYTNLFIAPVMGCVVPLFFTHNFFDFWRIIQVVYWIILIVGAGCWITSQQHRLNHPSKWPNPARAGIFLWGILSNLIVYIVYLYPVTGSDPLITGLSWASIAFVFYSLFGFFYRSSRYYREYQLDWKVLESGIKGSDFCDECEQIKVPGVRHCRLCGRCFSNLQHHCLFLMKCVTADNARYFTYILVSNLISCVAFITNVIFYLQNGLVTRDEHNQLNIMLDIGNHLMMFIVFAADFICVFCSIMLLKLQLTDPYSWPRNHQQHNKLASIV